MELVLKPSYVQSNLVDSRFLIFFVFVKRNQNSFITFLLNFKFNMDFSQLCPMPFYIVNAPESYLIG